jgi:hypothetical protein
MPGHASIALLETLGYEKSNKKLLNLPGSYETKDPNKQNISRGIQSIGFSITCCTRYLEMLQQDGQSVR